MSPHSTQTETMAEQAPALVNGPATNGVNAAENGVHGSTHDHVDTPVEAPVDAPKETTTITQDYTNGNAITAGVVGGRPARSAYLKPVPSDTIHDMICVGFGPASLAIAIATHDSLESGALKEAPKVLFLEKQARFAWHAGMLLPGAKMQINFIKDLASLRDPRSHFTFLNYLHKNDRLVEYINLDTFLPARAEYEDYLRWCANHFEDVVQYGSEVVHVSPAAGAEGGPQKIFDVTSRNAETGEVTTYQARNVVLALGGQPSIPQFLPANHPRVVHSSLYETMVPKILMDRSAPVRVAVIGGGQSAAEIFNNVQQLYPNSRTYMLMKAQFLKPSDDSPFVNSIFNPSFIDSLYPRSKAYRASLINEARATNYGVVRLGLIEHLYEKMYEQLRELGRDESKWPRRIMGGRRIVHVEENPKGLRIKTCLAATTGEAEAEDGPLLGEETIDVDLVVAATGYRRAAHVEMLKDLWHMLPENTDANADRTGKDRWYVDEATGPGGSETTTRVIEVGRNYAVRFVPGKVAEGSGIWLQGCCEGTHGLSDTLLSVLSTRSGEMVQSIFGRQTVSQ